MIEELFLIVPTLINGIAMVGIVLICLKELNTASVKKSPIRRIQYIILMVGVLLSGCQPVLWATIPSLGTALLSTCLLLFLTIHSTKRNTK